MRTNKVESSKCHFPWQESRKLLQRMSFEMGHKTQGEFTF